MKELTNEEQADVMCVTADIENSGNGAAFRAIRLRGAVVAVVYFSGGGDSGGVDRIELLDAAGDEVGKVGEDDSLPDGTSLWDVLGKPVYDRYYSFAGEFYVDGTVTWDVVIGEVNMERDERSTEDGDDYNDEGPED